MDKVVSMPFLLLPWNYCSYNNLEECRRLDTKADSQLYYLELDFLTT